MLSNSRVAAEVPGCFPCTVRLLICSRATMMIPHYRLPADEPHARTLQPAYRVAATFVRLLPPQTQYFLCVLFHQAYTMYGIASIVCRPSTRNGIQQEARTIQETKGKNTKDTRVVCMAPRTKGREKKKKSWAPLSIFSTRLRLPCTLQAFYPVGRGFQGSRVAQHWAP